MRMYERSATDLLTEILAGEMTPLGYYIVDEKTGHHLLFRAREEWCLDLYMEDPWHIMVAGLTVELRKHGQEFRLKTIWQRQTEEDGA